MSEQTPGARQSIYRHMLRGSAWGVAMRWSVRAIGLASVVVLARLLTPEDFGIMAIGALLMGFIHGLSELGTQMLLIREPNVDRGHIDTAWTIKILQGLLIGLVLVAVAPLAVSYFDEPRVERVMHILALCAVLEGCENIGMVLVRKELDFARDFRFYLYKRIFQFAVTITLAFVLRSYWALILGQLATSAFGLVLSYLMHPHRPRLCLVRAREYLAFAGSIVPMNVGRYLNKKVDVAVVGGIGTTVGVGVYNVASELSSMVTQEIVIPIGRGLMPSYAKLVEDRERLGAAFRHVLSSVTIICVPIAFGLFVTAEDFVALVLGEQWEAVTPLIKWLAIYGLLASLLQTMSGQILIVSRHERRSALLMWARVAVLVPLTVAGGVYWGIEGVAIAAMLAAFLVVPLVVYVLTISIPITLVQIVDALWRAVAAGVLMAGIVSFLHLQTVNVPALTFVLDVATGVLSYVAVLWLLWRACGQPQGVERVVVDVIAQRFRQRPAV